MWVFLGRKGEDESASRTHDTTDLREMDQRVVPEIHRVHGVYPVEVCIGIGNPIAAGLLHLDQNLIVGASLATSEGFYHVRRNVYTRHESVRRQLQRASQCSAVSKA